MQVSGSPILSTEGSPASFPFLLLWQAPLPALTPSSHVCPAPRPSPPAGSPFPHLRLFSFISKHIITQKVVGYVIYSPNLYTFKSEGDCAQATGVNHETNPGNKGPQLHGMGDVYLRIRANDGHWVTGLVTSEPYRTKKKKKLKSRSLKALGHCWPQKMSLGTPAICSRTDMLPLHLALNSPP